MNTEVRMPQLGESIAEGTLVRWFKSVGDSVKRDEPLFEITTDKVDTEVPAPRDGYLTRILVEEGETVLINTPVCVLGDDASAPSEEHAEATGAVAERSGTFARAVTASAEGAAATETPSRVERLRTRSSPLVRRLAAEHGVDLSQLSGTGAEGRVTKSDLSKYLEERSGAVAPRMGDSGRLEAMSPMRRRIAEHMVMSRRTSAHVTTVFEVDMTDVRKRKAALAADLLQQGVRLTYLPFIVIAARDALQRCPILNASIEGDRIRYHDDINIGIAVALDDGLIVPVVKKTDSMSLAEIARAAQDLANRAREKALKPEEVQGGTFTITNPGVFGALIGTPIIHQPQLAILCVGAIEKRPVVITGPAGEDTIAVRSMCYLSLSYDHRAIDGRTADEFLGGIKAALENPPP